ncbi:hypothetical protein L1D14_09175 [Vibrio tubiashii]|uniref:hypothetical protein n=1 Tax=Vibrio tubiashii TaxID=29498 RepID=UPI001EFD0507|nr:hypothetical protein [Vibrio tubiashii]MCG9576409.1 hypothetical protein [Vibrio tubiashii]
MANDNYPFPPKSSAYWVDSTTNTSYDDAVAMFEAQSDVDKKMGRNPIRSEKVNSSPSQIDSTAAKDTETANVIEKNNTNIQADALKQSNNSTDLPAEQCLDDEFMLGWHQVTESGSVDLMWDELLTPETPKKTVWLLKKHNKHLNSYVNEGEIVVLLTTEPKTDEDKTLLENLKEEAKAASIELGKLLSNEVATLNRHFDVWSYKLDERITADGLPTDYYAQVSTGVGATSALVEQNLKNIQSVLLEINSLYASQVAMASRTGGINYGAFVSERAALFKKLDGSFAMLSKRSVQIPIYMQIKRNLKLSTKSVVHNADEILKSGFVPNLGKRIANIAKGISAARGLGYVGLLLGATSSMNNIYEACRVDGTGDCGKTTTREASGFLGSIGGGILGGNALAAGAVVTVSGIALLLGVTASAPVIALAAVSGYVTGGFTGGVVGSAAGKAVGDVLYEWATE